ncbi:MAG: DNA-directed RNA polymerase subunit omega [Firmicutes bacterium]|nr:DNA-directed RNA polymerase subunit omega [Bacillota bacterium]HOB34406.1 DNA-directed RNA polymerase subunit omega [Bacillota bacterium]HPZ89854.1 DNA-directed RNA polymerase subunit omega [Bacillota bacterium]HQE01130.1 DNA-directed RNA polymerase subunit omega [Bacillota bacterium]
MLKPSIDDLLQKVDSKYTLVVAAARRARNIQARMSKDNVKNRAMKPVTIALHEILNDQLEYQRTKQGDLK